MRAYPSGIDRLCALTAENHPPSTPLWFIAYTTTRVANDGDPGLSGVQSNWYVVFVAETKLRVAGCFAPLAFDNLAILEHIHGASAFGGVHRINAFVVVFHY